MNQRNDRADAEPKLEAKPNVDAHHDRGDDNGHDATEPEILADLRADKLDASDFELIRAELVGESLFDLFSEGTDFHRGFLQPNQVFVGSLLAEILDLATA